MNVARLIMDDFLQSMLSDSHGDSAQEKVDNERYRQVVMDEL